MNAHATVNFPTTTPEAEIPRYIASAMRGWKQWLRRHGFSGTDTAYIWVRETHGTRTSHVHILLHVPAEIRREVTNKRIARLFPRVAGFHLDQIEDKVSDNSGALVLVKHRNVHQPNWVRYVAKGVQQAIAHQFPELRNASPQGNIAGKRHGISENINGGEQFIWNYEERWLGPREARYRWGERSRMSKKL